jgi:Fe-S-cluster-containing dehydrogenase component
MNSCPTGAIKRRPEGEIYFQYDMCIGCGNCAIACPYDNIAMIDTPIFDKAQARKSHIMNDSNFFRIRLLRTTWARQDCGSVCSAPVAKNLRCASRSH